LTDHAAIERFQALYADHHARVYAYAVSRVGRQLADEVVSEVFLVAWRRLADVPVPALPWLLTVARNTACSQFRGSARQRSISAEMRDWVTEAECSTATYFVRLHRARRRLERAMADPPEPTAPGPQDRAVSGPPEPAVAGPPECAATDPPERAMPGPPDRDLPDLPGRDVADLPERDMADLPGRTSADSPGAARLGHPVLAHRKERSL